MEEIAAKKNYHFALQVHASKGNLLERRFIATNAFRSFFRHAEACKVAQRNGRLVILFVLDEENPTTSERRRSLGESKGQPNPEGSGE